MQLVGDRTLTSKAGSFTFDPKTRLSHAKLIRDAITTSFRGALRGVPRINANKPQFAPRWVRENIDGPVGKEEIVFTWDPLSSKAFGHEE
jgi:hypothetical protein